MGTAKTTTIGRRAGVIAALLLGCIALQAEATGPEAPAEVVRHLQESLLESMKAGENLDFAQRTERLRPVIERTHHFDAIARFMLGRHARELDDDQLVNIADALGRLSVAEYASRFDRHKGEKLGVLESSGMGEDRVMVATELIKANGEPVRLEYMLERRDGTWGVVNVIADGVSDLALKRAEYSAVLREDGYAALLDRLHEQTAEIGPK